MLVAGIVHTGFEIEFVPFSFESFVCPRRGKYEEF
jgi:hypothetical protein